MPMYEFLCPDCNTIFTFFSRTVNTATVPTCPQCRRRELRRMVSRFSVSSGAQEEKAGKGEGGADLPVDEARMAKAMESLASEAENVNGDDPKAAANLMRRFSDMTGIRFGDRVENALERLEAGEDPESLEKEMAGLDENDIFRTDGGEGTKAGRRRRPAPRRDETLYEM